MLITDLGMPVVDGREVARCVKQASRRTRVLLLTGWADRLRIEGDTPDGVDQLLGKPITKAQLQEAIAGVAREPATVPSNMLGWDDPQSGALQPLANDPIS